MRTGLRALAAVAALLAASLLAGCATIPRSGPVVEGGSVSSQDSDFGQIAYHPDGPAAGASQEAVLRGFIDAAVSPDSGYQVAREFLASSFRNQWNPDAGVIVDQEGQRVEPKRENSTSLELDVAPVAFVDQAGNYASATSTAPIPSQYGFVKEGGQWRISKAPDGIVIDADRFQSVFSPHTLYFYSPDFHYLVPDERWFPSTSASISTRIVKALLTGPSAWLKDAVVTAFPNGTQLSSGSVPAQDGVAQVDLTSVAASADQAALDRMGEQLSESLSSSSAITSVRLTIAGVGRGNGGGATGAVQDPPVGTNPIVLAGGKFGTLSGKTVTPLTAIGGKIASLQPRAAAVTADGAAAAVLGAAGVYAVAAIASTPVLVDDRHGLIAPSIDNGGAVWSTTDAAAGDIHVAVGDGKSVDLPTSWPDAHAVLGISVSRDGTRLAALVRTEDGQSHVMVAGIVRDGTGHPTRLGEPLDLGNVALSEGRSLAWTDELTVVVLGDSPQGGTAIVQQTIGGTRQTTPGPDGGTVIAGGNPDNRYWVLDGKGALQTSGGSGWQTAATGVGVLGVQQGRG